MHAERPKIEHIKSYSTMHDLVHHLKYCIVLCMKIFKYVCFWNKDNEIVKGFKICLLSLALKVSKKTVKYGQCVFSEVENEF